MLHRDRRRPEKPIRKWEGPKPKLPMRVTYNCRVHYKDLEAYLAKVYGMRGYDVLMASRACHGICPEYVVNGEPPPANNAKQQMDNIRRGRKTRNVGLILNVLCMDGFIPAGRYVIDTRKLADPTTTYTRILEETGDPSDPRCREFREKHSGNRQFMQRASLLDQRAREYRKSLEPGR